MEEARTKSTEPTLTPSAGLPNQLEPTALAMYVPGMFIHSRNHESGHGGTDERSHDIWLERTGPYFAAVIVLREVRSHRVDGTGINDREEAQYEIDGPQLAALIKQYGKLVPWTPPSTK